MMSKNSNTHGLQFVRQLIVPLGTRLSDAQLLRRASAVRRSLLKAVPAAGGTSCFVTDDQLVPHPDGLYLELWLQPRAQQVLFVPEGESPTVPPRLRDDAIRRCGDIHAAVDGAEPDNPIERGEIQGALRHLDGTTLAMEFPDGQLELGYPSAPIPQVRQERVVVSGSVRTIELGQLRLERPVQVQPGGTLHGRRLARRLTISLPRGAPENANTRLAAVHAMNAREALWIEVIAAISPDEDIVREVRLCKLMSDDNGGAA